MNEMEHMMADVDWLVAKGWSESNAIRAVAAKYDVPDYELAMLLLENASKELLV